ncbi:HNH endonuclease family protein [Cellulomonas endophytica]|uniref:HNH endonuclease family protein n=1 Tax=Cellulomonas endophytica TaxID=2494735 RepID=UPI0030B823AE
MRRWTGLLLVVLALAVAAGTGLPTWSSAREAADHPVTAADLARARADLAALVVQGRAPLTGYDRSAFGTPWADVDGNGCGTRDDVLARDLRAPRIDPADGCTVLSGTLLDPYTGESIAFRRGPDSAEVQVDHVVALADAWQKGAQGWSEERRERFANDPANLLAVDGDANQRKGAGDAATWLPPRTGYRCAYVARQVRVKAAYGLAVTAAERDALARWLDRCVVVGAPEG